MTYQKLIEICCTANKGRSPIAAAIGNNYLEKKELNNQYKVISSGTHLDQILQGQMPLSTKVKVIKNGYKRGFYRKHLVEAENLVGKIKNENELEKKYSDDSELKTKIDQYAEKSRQRFSLEEGVHSFEAAERLDVTEYLKDKQEQLKPNPHVIAVLVMGKSNLKQAKTIYGNSEYNPIIELLKAYVTNNPDDEVKNAFADSKKVYDAVIEELKQLVPEAINKVISEDEQNEEETDDEE